VTEIVPPRDDDDFYQSLLDGMSDGVYFVDRDRTITYWSGGAQRLTGFAPEEVVGHSCRDGILNHADDAGRELCHTACPLQATMRDGKAREARVFMRHRDGHRQPVWVRAVPLRGPGGNIVGAIEVFSDDGNVIAIRERLAEMERLAMTDRLTGIGNRRYLDMQLASRVHELNRYGWPLGVLFVDIDHFKRVNDEYGRDVGDAVLRMVARTLSFASRGSDTVARYGGEEFVVLLANAGAPGLAGAAERFRGLVAQSRLATAGEHVEVTISLGGTLATPGDTHDLLLHRADTLLRAAKDAGRNRIQVDCLARP
jgi:diguanylate cyclase (GGDEF)-like protein/PAS domain S-box-containing protein